MGETVLRLGRRGIGLQHYIRRAFDSVPAWVLDMAALDADFAGQRGYNSLDLSKTSLDEILTYTSPSPKMVYGDAGVLRYAPHNLQVYSNDFANAAWTKNSSTVAAEGMTPDGSIATQLTNNTVSNAHGVYDAVVMNAPYTISAYMKAGTAQFGGLSGRSGNDCYAVFDLLSGTVDNSAGVTAAIEPVGNGWYRCSIISTTLSAQYVIVSVVETSGTTAWSAYVGTTKDIYIANAQLSTGPALLDYIPTTSAAVYSLPIDHNPVTLAPLGVLIEEQRTNLLLRSELFDNTSSWAVPAGATIVANDTTSPDGTLTADKLTRTSTLGVVLGYGGGGFGLALTAGVHTLSYFAKADTQNSLTVALVTSGKALGSEVVFDLSAGTAGVVTNYGATTGSVATIRELYDGWYRCSLTVTATTATWFMQAEMPSAGSYWLWGAQLEAGAFPTSYIPTVASQVTRAGDQVSILTSAFAYNASEGTLFADFTWLGAIGSHRVASLNDGTANERIEILTNSGNSILGSVVDGGVSQAALAGSLVVNTPTKIAMAYKVNDFALSKDGAAVVADASGTIPTVIRLDLGKVGGGAAPESAGHIKRLTYFPTRKSNAELQALAA